MSWQSVVVNMVLRVAKRSMRNKDFAAAKRAMMQSMARAEQQNTLPHDATQEIQTIREVPCHWISVGAARHSRQVVLYFHGGGFMSGTPASHRDLAWRLSAASGMKVLLVDYDLTPDSCFPVQLEQGLAVYRWLLEEGGYSAADIAFAGDSAGGNMTLAVMLLARQKQQPLPAAAVCISPWADLSHSGESIARNATADPMIPPRMLPQAAAVYAGAHDLKDPLVSPVFGDFSGFPPLYVVVGETEILLSDAERIVEQARARDVPVTYRCWPGQAHAFPVMGQFIPEARQAIEQMGEFLRETMAQA